MRPFSAWREGAPYYGPLLVAGAAMAVYFWPGPFAYVGLLVAAAGAYVVYFFRDPVRSIPSDPRAAVSPADGCVTDVERLDESPFYDGPCLRISIFLSVFNVHVNRAPLAGTVRRLEYKPGAFLDARHIDSAVRNEYNAIWMDTELGAITVRQVSGLIARRIICRCAEGTQLARGEKFGMIKFGSRTDLLLPAHAEPCVRVGDKVRGGADVVARFP